MAGLVEAMHVRGLSGPASRCVHDDSGPLVMQPPRLIEDHRILLCLCPKCGLPYDHYIIVTRNHGELFTCVSRRRGLITRSHQVIEIHVKRCSDRVSPLRWWLIEATSVFAKTMQCAHFTDIATHQRTNSQQSKRTILHLQKGKKA